MTPEVREGKYNITDSATGDVVFYNQSVIKGFYNKRDLDSIHQPKESFVILRHPVERVLSWFFFQHSRLTPDTLYPKVSGSCSLRFLGGSEQTTFGGVVTFVQ